jgi:hypothetical protein
MAMSSSYTADSSFSSFYYPSDNTSSFVQIVGTTLDISTPRTIVNSTDDGFTGEICWDSNYIYVCVGTNTWKRSTISTW